MGDVPEQPEPLSFDEALRALFADARAVGTEHGRHERQVALGEQYATLCGFRCRTATARGNLGAFVEDLLVDAGRTGPLPSLDEAQVKFLAAFVSDDGGEGPSWEDYGWRPPTPRVEWLSTRVSSLLAALRMDNPFLG